MIVMAKKKLQIVKTKEGKYNIRVGKTFTGKGVYACEDVPRGKFIAEYGGIILKGEDIDNQPNTKFLFEITKNKVLNGNHKSNLARYFNHSCKPNADVIDTDGRMYIHSKRRIKEGEEITYNYGKEYFDDFIKPYGCKCLKCLGK